MHKTPGKSISLVHPRSCSWRHTLAILNANIEEQKQDSLGGAFENLPMDTAPRVRHPGSQRWRKSHLFWDTYNIYLFRIRTSPSKKVGNVVVDGQNCYCNYNTLLQPESLINVVTSKTTKVWIFKGSLRDVALYTLWTSFSPFKNLSLKIPAEGQHIAVLLSGLTFNTTLTSHFAFSHVWPSEFGSDFESCLPFYPHTVDYLIWWVTRNNPATALLHVRVS